MLSQGLQTAVSLIYPARCLCCGMTVDSDHGLCGTCWRETSFVGGTVCDACGVPLPGGNTGESPNCDTCLVTPRPWVQGRAALSYRDNARKMVLALKHGDRQEIARPAALWMANAVRHLLPENTLIAPVPLHWTRMVKRRYNQSALLAKELAATTDLPWCPDLLQRVKRTRSLDGLGRDARHQEVQGSIQVRRAKRMRLIGRPVLLVDDVMTSGATLGATAQACIDAGSGPVRVVVLARAGKET